ncbi:aspartyl protease family protein [Spirosoma sp. KNUC1025]|uniref:aspartyl protease family protein n=1 Tax=Spirosoma sp. KNUC1025 TaxID=2894082 RepID=UPI003864EF28|nr:aspartyl protease family protein [Spirosoma sp. KNUC1025]
MKLHSLFVLVYVIFVDWQAVAAQDNRYGFYFTNRQMRVHIPFQFRSNLIIIPVCINEREVASFIVDTGVGPTIITDARAFQLQHFTVSRRLNMAGVGGENTLEASVAINNSIRVGSLRADHHALVILQEDVLNLSEYAGVPIHGIIGYELFANLVVTIDFQHQVLTLTQPDHFRYRRSKGDRYPISIQDNKAYTNALSVSNGSQSLPLRLVIDTGAGQALLLDRYQRSAAPVSGKIVRVPLGRGLTGFIHGQMGRLPMVYIGRYLLNNVLVSYPDSTDFGRKLTNLPQRQGNVGCELLRRFRVTFNFPERYMILKPVKQMLRAPFEHDMSGLELRARSDNLSRYFIAQLVRQSPAERAGLQVGDELLIINNSPADTLTMGDIQAMLQAGDGKPVSLIIRRHGQLIPYHFSLKRLI